MEQFAERIVKTEQEEKVVLDSDAMHQRIVTKGPRLCSASMGVVTVVNQPSYGLRREAQNSCVYSQGLCRQAAGRHLGYYKSGCRITENSSVMLRCCSMVVRYICHYQICSISLMLLHMVPEKCSIQVYILTISKMH